MTADNKQSVRSKVKGVFQDGYNRAVTSESVRTFMDELLSHGVDGKGPFSGARDLAESYRGDGRYSSVDEMVDSMIRWESSKNFSTGVLSGMGGAAALPVSIPAGIYTSWLLQVRLAAAVALLYGHPIEDEKTRSFVLLALLGDRAKETVKSAGITAAKVWGEKALQKVPEHALAKINQSVGFRLLSRSGEGGLISMSKIIPVAGGVVSGIFDAITCYVIGKASRKIFGSGVLPGDEEHNVILYENHLSKIITSATKHVRNVALPQDNIVFVRFKGIPVTLKLWYISFTGDIIQFMVKGNPFTRRIVNAVLGNVAKHLHDNAEPYITRSGKVLHLRINDIIRDYGGGIEGISLKSLDVKKGKVLLNLG